MKNETQIEDLKQSRQALKEGFLTAFSSSHSQDYVLDMMEMAFFPLGKKEEAFHLRWDFADETQWTPKMLKHLAFGLYSDHDGISDAPDDNLLSEEEYEADFWPSPSEMENRWFQAYCETVETILEPSLWDARISCYGFSESCRFFEAMSSFRGRENLWSGLCLSEAFEAMNLRRLKVHLESDIEEAVGYMVAKVNEKCFLWEAEPQELEPFYEGFWGFLDGIGDAIIHHTVFQDGWILRK